jgi:two-component system sensor kinase FixL
MTWLEIRQATRLVVPFVALYVLLDWASYLAPLQGLNLTPWNPTPALGILYVARRGWMALPALWLAIVASDILVRGAHIDTQSTLLLAAALALGYATLARTLQRHLAEGGLFSSPAELFKWSLIISVGTLLIGLLYVFALLATGLLAAEHWLTGLVRFWIGDCVGIFIALPLMWRLQDAPRRKRFLAALRNWESVGYGVLILVALWVAFDLGAQAHFRYFYVLFLPVVWAASRQGLTGAVLCVSLLQVGMVVAGSLQDASDISLLELQIRALMLALVGFIIGTAIDEQRRAAADLRQTTRLAVAGEMAGALAHEINQPLTALSAYASACERVSVISGQEEQLRELVKRLAQEVRRLAGVVGRLCDFLRTGATQLETVSARELLEEACRPFRELEPGIHICLGPVPAVALYMAELPESYPKPAPPMPAALAPQASTIGG